MIGRSKRGVRDVVGKIASAIRGVVVPIRSESPSGGGVDGRPSILLGVTTDTSLMLLDGFPQYLASNGWLVHIVSSPGPRLRGFDAVEGIEAHAVHMVRRPSPLADFASLLRWVSLLRRVKPDVISVGTPKAGLLGCLAGALTRVPCRIYTLRGLRSETSRTPTRALVNVSERLAGGCAHRVLCVSPSLRDVVSRAKLMPLGKLVVLGPGSSNGVDPSISILGPDQREMLRVRHMGSTSRYPLVGFVGRVTADKGLDTLADALALLAAAGDTGDCLIVGGDDAQDSARIRARLDESGWNVVHTGHVDHVSELLQIMDVLCLPSLREGFPNVVLEAAVAGVPCIGSDATGVVDSIVHGETGFIFDKGDPSSLAAMITTIRSDTELAGKLGRAAKRRAVGQFSRDVIWPMHHTFYQLLLSDRRSIGREHAA